MKTLDKLNISANQSGKDVVFDLTLSIRRELEAMAEPDYQSFSSKLVPGCGHMLGVRLPNIRSLARKLVKENPFKRLEDYIQNTADYYFEETMLKGMLIGCLKTDIETVLKLTEEFLPRITNWSVCDSFCMGLKIVKKHMERVWEFLIPYTKSNQPYEVRMAVVMSLSYYIEPKYLQELFSIFQSISLEHYYVKMAVAWAVSVCYVKYPQETYAFLQQHLLEEETFHKALQKIRESLRVSREEKEKLRLLLADGSSMNGNHYVL